MFYMRTSRNIILNKKIPTNKQDPQYDKSFFEELKNEFIKSIMNIMSYTDGNGIELKNKILTSIKYELEK